MLLWITIVGLTCAALIMAFWPAFAKSEGVINNAKTEEFEHDIAVYKDQLGELDLETERGAISQSDAKQARVEIARRLLAAEDKRDEMASLSESRRSRAVLGRALAGFALIFVPGMALLMYTSLGSPTLEAQPLAARIEALKEAELAASDSDRQLRQLVTRAESHLMENPEDGRGWDVLAPVYFRLGEAAKSGDAYRNAIRLLGESALRLSGLGEVSVTVAGGVVTAEASDLFARAASLDALDGRALYYLGLAEAQAGKPDAAALSWNRIVDNEAIEANWRVVAAQSLSRLASVDAESAQQEANLPNPDQATVDAAGEMPSDDRRAMIAGMVEQLDARLRDEGGSMEEWQRLIRAHIVLDQAQDARDALDRAVAAFEGSNAEQDEIRQFGKLIGVGMEAPKSQ